jgi:hypothetical protein
VGVTLAQRDACRDACRRARPDFESAPECEQYLDCETRCLETIQGLPGACATCAIASIEWPQSHCFEFECTCQPPRFKQPDDFECEVQCSVPGDSCAGFSPGCSNYQVEFPFFEVDEACEWELPPAPNGETLDPDLINVSTSFDCEAVSPLWRVDGEADCGELPAWYYSDLDSGLFALCPGACQLFRDEGRGNISVIHGCAQARLD